MIAEELNRSTFGDPKAIDQRGGQEPPSRRCRGDSPYRTEHYISVIN
jgi:hypothetical protein